MQLVHNNPVVGLGQGVAPAAAGGELNAPSSLQQPPPNGNVAPFSRTKPKSKLLNGFSEEPKKEIVAMSREDCEKLTKSAIKCVRRPGKGGLGSDTNTCRCCRVFTSHFRAVLLRNRSPVLIGFCSSSRFHGAVQPVIGREESTSFPKSCRTAHHRSQQIQAKAAGGHVGRAAAATSADGSAK